MVLMILFLKIAWGRGGGVSAYIARTSPPAAPLLSKERFRDVRVERIRVPRLGKERLGEVKQIPVPLLGKERLGEVKQTPVPLLGKERLGEVKRVGDKTIVFQKSG